ncbi:chemotaxis protein CheW [Endothiovibrio diazotrophicus]
MTTSAMALPGEDEREATQYLTFVVAGETFGMAIASIHEIIDFGDLTRVPLVPDYIRGVINLRGNVVPVIDLSARLGRGPTVRGKRTSMVIVELPQADQANLTLGVMVDVVNEVIEIEEAEIEPPPPFGTPVRPDFIDGMARREEGFMILLDPERVFAVEELSILEGMPARRVPARDGEGATP